MPFPIKTCIICEAEFELKPNKSGYANRCPQCSTPEATELIAQHPAATNDREANAARRAAMRNLLYRKDS